MAQTDTSPSFLDQAQDFGFDWARNAAGIDVESSRDDNNIPDQVDVRTGNAPAQSQDMGGFSKRIAGLPMWGWGVIGVGVLGLGFIAFRK